MYRYYVSFSHKVPSADAIGAMDITMDLPIRTLADVPPLREYIASKGFHDVMILAFSAYAEQPTK
jgi:hypothetical protein